jgi:predicted amidohydrolase YtcJ
MRPAAALAFAALALASSALTSPALTSPALAAAAPDAVYLHGKVVTLERPSATAQAFAVGGDRFVAVGSDADIRARAGKATKVIDLHGATVVPGLCDSHDHLWNAGKYLTRGVDLVGVTSLAEMQARLRAAVAKARPGETVSTTTGWAVRPAPTRKDLDAVSATVPIVVVASRRGTGVMNSAALARLGIDKGHLSFQGAKAPVDDTGEPTGAPAPYPQGVLMVDALLPPMTQAQQDALVAQAMHERNALGITCIRELAAWPDEVTALQRIRREGKFTVRVALGVEFPDPQNTAAHLAALPRPDRSDPWLFLDSSGEEPWTPGVWAPGPYADLMRAENRLGWRPAPHVSADVARGIAPDDATDDTLSGYEAAGRDSPLAGKRWYIEHVPFATPAQLDRMARLGLVVSIQDAGYRPAAAAPVPSDRMARQNPVRDYIDHGLWPIGGSDYLGPTPTDAEPNNPFVTLAYYVTRKTTAGDAPTAAQKVTREEALRIFTVNPAYAAFQEKRRGAIAAGMLADFVVLDRDLMTVAEDHLRDTRPLATFVGGRKVYSAAGSGF